MSSLFGSLGTQQQQQQRPPTTSIFGASTQQQPSTSALGNSLAQPPTIATGGLFGNPAGNTGANAPAAQQPQAGGLFGNMNPTQQQQPTAGLFGNAPQPAAGGAGLFGNMANANRQQQQQPSGSALFSSLPAPQNQQQQQQQPTTTGGLFGATAGGANTGGTNLFGNRGPNALFGNTGPSTFTTTTVAPITTNPFTQFQTQTQAPIGGATFGQPQQPASSLFGQQPQAQAQATSGAGSSLFGQFSTQQKPSNALFGTSTSTQPMSTGTLFGSTTNTLGAGSLLGRAGLAGQQDAQAQFPALLSRIESVAGQWGLGSGAAACQFQYYFYNLVDPSQVRLYGRPPNATDEEAWARAVRENPDPTCLVPVLAVGFDDLQQRVNAQSQQAIAHEEKLKELKTRIDALTLRHTTSNIARIQRASTSQAQLTQRLLKLVQHLHLLIPSLRSSSIKPEEEALRVALEDIEVDVTRRGIGSGRMRARLNELWALVSALQAARDREKSAGIGGVEWAVVDEDGLAQITQILSEQQAGLAHLTKVLQKDLKDLSVISGTGGLGGEKGGIFGSSTKLQRSVRR